LQRLDGIPRFQKHWPIAQRDAALAACVAYLKQYGERFRENGAARAIRAAEPGIPGHEQPILAFDPLDHPATPDDVAAGRAIFTLAGTGVEVRRADLPALPLDARWTKLTVFQDDPNIPRSFDAEGNELSNIELLQAGRVWQAEEVHEGNHWRCYYGFAGRHALTRVAADEIVFLTRWGEGWRLLSSDLDGRIEIKPATMSGPLPMTFSFRNHRGVETTVPTELVRGDGGAGAITVRDGITFRLIRESDRADQAALFEEPPGADNARFAAEEIAAKPIRRHAAGTASRPLAPAASVEGFELDVRTLFTVDQPGVYRLEITFEEMRTSEGTPAKVDTTFAVAGPNQRP
jgi:hypothetical protein